jgi:hypothetical protein
MSEPARRSESPPDLEPPQVIKRTTGSPSASEVDSIACPDRQMCAEFIDFFASLRLLAVATALAANEPQIAPILGRLSWPQPLRLAIYDRSVRHFDPNPSRGWRFQLGTRWGPDYLWPRARRPIAPGSGSGRPTMVGRTSWLKSDIYTTRALTTAIGWRGLSRRQRIALGLQHDLDRTGAGGRSDGLNNGRRHVFGAHHLAAIESLVVRNQ